MYQPSTVYRCGGGLCAGLGCGVPPSSASGTRGHHVGVILVDNVSQHIKLPVPLVELILGFYNKLALGFLLLTRNKVYGWVK